MDCTVSSYPKDTIYSHEWTIEEFAKAMYRNDGTIDSPSFKMPGLQQWSFFLRVTQSECDRKMNYNDDVGRIHAKRDELVIEGVKYEVSHLFDVWLMLENPSDDLKKIKLAGTLEVSQGTTEIRSKGHFIGLEKGLWPYFAESSGSEFASCHADLEGFNSDVAGIHLDGWQFAKERFRSFKWGTQLYLDPYDELPCADFFALNHTPSEVTMKASIKIPSDMVHSSGLVNGPADDFKHLLNQKELSDVTLKMVDGREIPCHRVILANKSSTFKRMLTSDMLEDRTGVVDIVLFEVETIEKLLEFIYSGKIEDMGDQLDKLFKAADYYEVMDLIDMCLNLFGKKDVTPSNAVFILEIAQRYTQASKLKERVLAWIKAEWEIYKEDAGFTEELRRHPQLMIELDMATEWSLDDI